MGIADLFRPKYRHSDVRVRAEAVKALTVDDAATLVQIARTDRDSSVRRIALEKIDEADVLAELAAAESERSLRDYAGERAAQIVNRRANATRVRVEIRAAGFHACHDRLERRKFPGADRGNLPDLYLRSWARPVSRVQMHA